MKINKLGSILVKDYGFKVSEHQNYNGEVDSLYFTKPFKYCMTIIQESDANELIAENIVCKSIDEIKTVLKNYIDKLIDIKLDEIRLIIDSKEL